MPSKTSRFWCFTLHPRSLDDGSEQTIANKLPEKARYCVYQRERSADGKEHYQGYIEFHDAVAGGQRTSWVKDWIPGAHTEIKCGKREDARHYCIKPCSANCDNKHCVEARRIGDGRINWETSEPTVLGTYIEDAQGNRSDVDEIKKAIDEGASFEQICNMNFSYAMSHSRSLKDYIATKEPKRDWKTHVRVICGDSGTGKSRWCHETYPDAYWLSKSSSGNVWWNGYTGQDTIIIDDFYGWVPFDYMLHFMDRYKMTGETKGGVVNIKPRNIVITSNREPRQWYKSCYKNDKQLEIAFSRRIDVIEQWKWARGKTSVIKTELRWDVEDDIEDEEEDVIMIPAPIKGGRLAMRSIFEV